MGLSPAEAALTGTAFGALATFSSAWLIQRATTRRERENRVWDRRMAVYDEVMIVVRRMADLRETVRRTGAFPERRPDDTGPADAMSPLLARLEIYGSDALLTACKRAFAARRRWNLAWGTWHTQRDNNPRISDNDEFWVEFKKTVKKSRKADRRVLSLLRAEVHAERISVWRKLQTRLKWIRWPKPRRRRVIAP
ncbi:hypothetical protein [Streptomyces atriruber]|uniref:hypothetical protein n=1 Tax=Streptomyces atriruber TaxID=545121 RepID=UPI0006E29839|nr:hypothetical protein [Streptomyces atriruber]